MAEKCLTERLYTEVSSFIDKAAKQLFPSSETMNTAICTMITSPAFVRDRVRALEILRTHFGPDSHTGLSEDSCVALEGILRPIVLELANRQREV